MRHGKKFNHLGRQKGHRSALLSNMANSLIMHKRINTTVAKAKALKKYVEPIITKAKVDSTHSRRVVFSYLQSKEATKELFSAVAAKVADRPGGYTRILRTGFRQGDSAEMCFIELVDFNEAMLTEAAPKKKSRRRKKKAAPKVEASVKEAAAIEEAEVVEATEEAPEADAEKTEEVVAEAAATEEVVEETTSEEASAEESPKAEEEKKEEDKGE